MTPAAPAGSGGRVTGYLRVPIHVQRRTGYGYARLYLTAVWRGCAYSRIVRLPGWQLGPRP